MVHGHDPALTVPGIESVPLEFFPLGIGQQVTFHPYQGFISWAGLCANPGPKHFGSDGGLAGVGSDSWQVLRVDHWSFATAPESYSMVGSPEPPFVTF